MPPNVLLVVVDQLAAHTLGCYGGPVPTPNVDRLAEDGAVFADATCPTPFCSPSRASLATGQYPHTHGIVHNVMRRDYPRSVSEPTEEGLRADDPTLGRLLADAGYDTHHYGKFHLLDEELPYFPDMFTEHDAYAKGMAERFREVRERPREEWLDWYGWALPVTVDERYRAALDPVREELAAAGGHDEFLTKMGRLEFDPEETFDWQVADRAAERVQSAEEPFFVTASFNWPHDPNVVPDPYYSRFDPDDVSLPDNYGAFEKRFAGDWSREFVSLAGERGVREFLRVYYAMVAFVDEQVGRVLDALDGSGRAEDTVVVFTADHGDMAGGHGMVWKSTEAFYEEVMRVPLVVRGPGVESGDDEVDCAASLVDVLPTVCDLLDRPELCPDGVQGRSLAPRLSGAPDADAPRFSLAERVAPNELHTRSEHPGDDAFALRGEGYKYVRYPDGEYLYDLSADPGEADDLSDDPAAADDLDAMRAELAAFLDRTDYPRAV